MKKFRTIVIFLLFIFVFSLCFIVSIKIKEYNSNFNSYIYNVIGPYKKYSYLEKSIDENIEESGLLDMDFVNSSSRFHLINHNYPKNKSNALWHLESFFFYVFLKHIKKISDKEAIYFIIGNYSQSENMNIEYINKYLYNKDILDLTEEEKTMLVKIYLSYVQLPTFSRLEELKKKNVFP